jgi:beta-ribofuranosylaminobenzene 5'-phosphate synthase
MITKSKVSQVNDHRHRKHGFDTQILLDWLNDLIKKLNIQEKFTISISGKTLSHFGFGCSTSIRMASIEGISLLLGLKLSHQEMIHLSRRGGTSGIGVHGYFKGGLIFDIGHAASENSTHLPSRSKEFKQNYPLLFNKIDLPNWEVGLLIPKNLEPISHDNEKIFFEKNCPISSEAVYQTTYHAVFGVCAAIKSKNKEHFHKAIMNIQKQEWKKKEWELYPSLPVLKNKLYEFGTKAVGISSLGPSLYFFADDIESIITKFQKPNLKKQCDILKVSFQNTGRKVICQKEI